MVEKQLNLTITESKVRLYNKELGKIRQWIDGFEAAGKQGPVSKDMLRQIQIWLKEAK